MNTFKLIPVISVVVAFTDVPTAVECSLRPLGATVLWSLGAVAEMEVKGALLPS